MSSLRCRPSGSLPHAPTGKQVGIDVGLKTFYTDSEGSTVDNPRYLRKAEQKLKRLHRRVSRKVRSAPRIARRPSNAWQRAI